MSRFDFIIDILVIISLFIIIFIITKYKNTKENSKIINLKNDYSLKFYSIFNKKCSIKRLSNVIGKDVFEFIVKCDIHIGEDFILVEGFQDSIFKTSVKTFVLTSNPEIYIESFKNWIIYKPKSIELAKSKTQIKVIFQDLKEYSFIISELSELDFEKIKKIKNYC